MRVIKFRYWITDNDFFSDKEIPYMETEVAFEDYMSINDEIAKLRSNGNVVMQYTGLKDKNGFEIYENDICYDEHYECYGIIKFEEAKFTYIWEDICEDLIEVHDTIVIVGNLYENPQLLEEDTGVDDYIWVDNYYNNYNIKDMENEHLSSVLKEISKGGGYSRSISRTLVINLFTEAKRRGIVYNRRDLVAEAFDRALNSDEYTKGGARTASYVFYYLLNDVFDR